MVQAASRMSPEEAEAMLGRIWSVQYMAPGTLCAFAGAATAIPLQGAEGTYSHAVRLRFSNHQVTALHMTASWHPSALLMEGQDNYLLCLLDHCLWRNTSVRIFALDACRQRRPSLQTGQLREPCCRSCREAAPSMCWHCLKGRSLQSLSQCFAGAPSGTVELSMSSCFRYALLEAFLIYLEGSFLILYCPHLTLYCLNDRAK